MCGTQHSHYLSTSLTFLSQRRKRDLVRTRAMCLSSCTCSPSTQSLSLLTMAMASPFPITPQNIPHAWAIRAKNTKVFATKSGGLSFKQVSKGCKTCRGQGAVECPGCKGTGKNKKNGNMFERWKCFECQGFGMKSCPNCGKGGLTPEQRGER